MNEVRDFYTVDKIEYASGYNSRPREDRIVKKNILIALKRKPQTAYEIAESIDQDSIRVIAAIKELEREKSIVREGIRKLKLSEGIEVKEEIPEKSYERGRQLCLQYLEGIYPLWASSSEIWHAIGIAKNVPQATVASYLNRLVVLGLVEKSKKYIGCHFWRTDVDDENTNGPSPGRRDLVVSALRNDKWMSAKEIIEETNIPPTNASSILHYLCFKGIAKKKRMGQTNKNLYKLLRRNEDHCETYKKA